MINIIEIFYSIDSFDRMDTHVHCSTMPGDPGKDCSIFSVSSNVLRKSQNKLGFIYKPPSGEAHSLAAFHTADHYQVAFKTRPDVTYAELTLAPCETLLGPPHKTTAAGLSEYAQLDFERSNKFRTIMRGCEVGLEEALRRNRSPVADGCSETEVSIEASIEAPLIDNLKPANYHLAHDVIVS